MSSEDRQTILTLIRLYREPNEYLFTNTCQEFIDRLAAENDNHQYDDLIGFVEMLVYDESQVVPM